MKRKKHSISPLLSTAEKQHLFREIADACEIVGNCWVYRGEINLSGYGVKRVAGRRYLVSRIMLALATGESLNLPDYEACHVPQCADRRCCNPAHLHWGTKSENCKEREQALRVSITESATERTGISVIDRPKGWVFGYGSGNPFIPEGYIEA